MFRTALARVRLTVPALQSLAAPVTPSRAFSTLARRSLPVVRAAGSCRALVRWSSDAPSEQPPPAKPSPAPSAAQQGPASSEEFDDVDLADFWVHSFATDENDKLKPLNFISNAMQHLFIRSARAEIMPSFNAEEVAEGAKGVYRVMHDVMFNNADRSLIASALTPRSATDWDISYKRLHSSGLRVECTLHEILDAQLQSLVARVRREGDPIDEDTKPSDARADDDEGDDSPIVSVEATVVLLTRESYKIFVNGELTETVDNAFQKPVLELVADVARRGASNEIKPIDIEWRLLF
eukprot:m.245016 g.245016  ORF g.245016 m.245016 type:complete len:295 (+) comp14583_c0_seq1:54-938(+)